MQDPHAVNHYERLKVSQDAPPEVIRAAYRALAAKLHPDRQLSGNNTGPDDAMHAQMAALNQAYEVLIDPQLRIQYDATLTPSRAFVSSDERGELSGVATRDPGGPTTRVDMDWLTPKPAPDFQLWPPSRRLVLVGGGTFAAMAVVMGLWLWQQAGQHRMEQALSGQYGASPPGADQPGAARSSDPVHASLEERIIQRELATASRDPSPARRRPTVEELSRMSDEELLKVLPTLDAEGTASNPVDLPPDPHTLALPKPAVNHMLDGKPLDLRTDTHLIEALPPTQAGTPKRP